MRASFKIAVLAIVVLALNARPADAGFLIFWDYLEQLSGPGPFYKVVGASVDLLCDPGGPPYGLANIKTCFDPFEKPRNQADSTTWSHFQIGPQFSLIGGAVGH